MCSVERVHCIMNLPIGFFNPLLYSLVELFLRGFGPYVLEKGCPSLIAHTHCIYSVDSYIYQERSHDKSHTSLVSDAYRKCGWGGRMGVSEM